MNTRVQRWRIVHWQDVAVASVSLDGDRLTCSSAVGADWSTWWRHSCTSIRKTSCLSSSLLPSVSDTSVPVSVAFQLCLTCQPLPHWTAVFHLCDYYFFIRDVLFSFRFLWLTDDLLLVPAGKTDVDKVMIYDWKFVRCVLFGNLLNALCLTTCMGRSNRCGLMDCWSCDGLETQCMRWKCSDWHEWEWKMGTELSEILYKTSILQYCKRT